MTQGNLLEELKAYVGFDETDARLLAELGAALEPSFDAIVDEFYEAIDRTPRAAAVFREGKPQIARQKKQLRAWLVGVFGGVYDNAYFQRRARIGQAHVRIRLAQRYMFTAMSIVRNGLHRALDHLDEPSADRRASSHTAIDKICDIELAVMLETYRDRYVQEQRSQERMATLGQLAASVGQELRNPLAVIGTSAHLLRKHVGEGGERHVEKIARQIQLCEHIIGDLLALSGEQAPTRAPVDLVTLLEDVRASLPFVEGVKLDLDADAQVGAVSVDGVQMRQVILNLVVNAVQAVEAEGGGQVELRAHVDDDDLVVEVLDDGPGFPAGMRERVFEPLFTTKPGRVGIGLALCAQIIANHGGTIEALDRDGGGAHVRLRIPQTLDAT